MVTPSEAQPVSRGLVRWDLPLVLHGSPPRPHVWVDCECGERRPVHPGDMKRKSRNFTGACKPCHSREAYAKLNNRTGPQSSRFKGYRRVDKKTGYASVAVYPGSPFYAEMGYSGRHGACRYILEHRLVMACHLGRPLRSWEHVHHIDRDKTNNRIENLEIVDGKTHAVITALETEITRLTSELHRLRSILGEQPQPPGS